MENPSRRSILAVAAATVTLPLVQGALGRMKAAAAAAPAGAASAPAPGSWVTTTLKAADLKDNEFAAVAGQKMLVSRSGKTVMAMTNVCTHRQGAVAPKAGDKIGVCPLHKSEFNLDGTVNKGPATKPLDLYAIRLNKDGIVEIDPGTKPAKGDANASVTLA